MEFYFGNISLNMQAETSTCISVAFNYLLEVKYSVLVILAAHMWPKRFCTVDSVEADDLPGMICAAFGEIDENSDGRTTRRARER